MSAIKIIGKLNPKQYSEMLDHLIRKKIKNPFIKAEDIVVNKKPEFEEREMFNRFNQANPRQDMAGGGRMGFYKGELVTKGDRKGEYVIRNVPESVSKTRTIYFPSETAMNEWIESRPGRGRKDFGKFETGAKFKDTIQPKNLEKLKKLEEIINKSNSQYKKSLTSKAALQLAGFKEGYQSMSAQQTKLREEVRKLIGTLQSTGDKMDNYINNVMLSEDALVKDFKNPMQHLQKKFGVSRGFTDAWAPTSQVVKDNKRLFNNLANALSFNKYKQYADGTPRLMSDFSVVVQNKLPSSTSLLRADSAEKFILQSAYRHFKYNKDVGKASKINFIGDPDLLPINEWKFIKGGKLFSLDPAEDTIKFQGKNYKNNYLNRVDAKNIYKNDFGDVYKIFDDLETYMNSTTTIGNKDVKLDTVLRRKLFNATGKKNYLLRRAVEIDHVDINKDPFSNLRLLDRRTNVQAGLLKRLPKYKNNLKLLNKVLTDIGYTTPYKDVDTFIKRTTRNIDTPIKIIGDQNKKVIPAVDKVLASLGGGTCAVQFGKGNKDGGRIGYATGPTSLDDCIKSGARNFNEGKLKTADQIKDGAKLLRGGRAVLSALSKYGIVPELAYVGLEAAGRTVLGEKPTNALLKSIDTLTFGATDFTSEIEAEKFGEYAKDKLAVDAFRGSQAKVRSILNNLEKLEQINLEGGDVDVTQELQTLRAQLKSASDELRANTVNPDLVQFIDKRQEEISDTQLAKSPFAKQSLTNQLEGFPGIKDYMDTEATRVFPFQQTQKKLNEKVLSSLFDVKDAMQYTTSDAINMAQRLRAKGQDISAKDILAYRDSLRNTNLSGLAESGEYSPTSIYGASETFSTPLPSGALDKKPNVIPEIEREIVGQTNVANPFDIDISDIGSGLRGFAAAGGGIAKEAGDRSGPPPERGPMSQGLQGLMKRVRNL